MIMTPPKKPCHTSRYRQQSLTKPPEIQTDHPPKDSDSLGVNMTFSQEDLSLIEEKYSFAVEYGHQMVLPIPGGPFPRRRFVAFRLKVRPDDNFLLASAPFTRAFCAFRTCFSLSS